MLVKIKAQYDSKCAGCGRELKAGWDILYNKEEKKTFCTKCAKAGDTATTELTKTFGFAGYCANCSALVNREDESYYSTVNKEFYCSACGEKTSSPQAEIQLFVAKLESKFEELAGQNKLLNELLGVIHDQLSDLQDNVKIIFSEMFESKREKESKEKVITKKT